MVGLPLSPPRLMMVNGNSVSAQQTICVISCLRGSDLKMTIALANGDLITSPLCPCWWKVFNCTMKNTDFMTVVIAVNVPKPVCGVGSVRYQEYR